MWCTREEARRWTKLWSTFAYIFAVLLLLLLSLLWPLHLPWIHISNTDFDGMTGKETEDWWLGYMVEYVKDYKTMTECGLPRVVKHSSFPFSDSLSLCLPLFLSIRLRKRLLKATSQSLGFLPPPLVMGHTQTQINCHLWLTLTE